MEPHVRLVALMLNTFTHASAMVYTADEPVTTSECEYGNSQLGCLLLGTWEELEATVLWTRLPQSHAVIFFICQRSCKLHSNNTYEAG